MLTLHYIICMVTEDELVQVVTGTHKGRAYERLPPVRVLWLWFRWCHLTDGPVEVTLTDIWTAYKIWAKWNKVGHVKRQDLKQLLHDRFRMKANKYLVSYDARALQLVSHPPRGYRSGQLGYRNGLFVGLMRKTMPKRIQEDVDYDYLFTTPPMTRRLNRTELAWLNKFTLEYYNNRYEYKRRTPEKEVHDMHQGEERRERMRAYNRKSRDAAVIPKLTNSQLPYDDYLTSLSDHLPDMDSYIDFKYAVKRHWAKLTFAQKRTAQLLGIV